MISQLTVLLLSVLVLTSCALYPFGHSKNGSYFGGQGMSVAPRSYVPKELQREQPLFSLKFKSTKSPKISP